MQLHKLNQFDNKEKQNVSSQMRSKQMQKKMIGIQLNIMDKIRSNYMQANQDLKRQEIQQVDKAK